MTNLSFRSRLSPAHIAIIEQFTNDVPVKVGALAKALGLRVVEAALPLKISGLIKPDEDGSFVIKVNRFEPKERQRFTIAHEIAHFLLHRDKIQAGVVDSVLYRSKLSSRVEAEANRLAADLVMPREKVQELARAHGRNVGELVANLAESFQVSRQAMEIRTGD